MEFFNKKEEVIELVLTQKGRELFSQGKLNPVYYSFHDTDITYDNGNNEEQNNIVPRIKNTPTLKQNTNFYQNSSNSQNLLINKNVLYCEIGSKTFGDQYKPAWELSFLNSPPFQIVGSRGLPKDNKKFEVKLSSSYDINNSHQELIPQFDIQTIYEVGSAPANYPVGSLQNPFANLSELNSILLNTPKEELKGVFYYLGTGGKNFVYNTVDNTATEVGIFTGYLLDVYLIKDDPVLLTITEDNCFENNENQEYEIEAFFVSNNSDYKKIEFNIDEEENIFKYLEIYFDEFALINKQNNIKNIYGNLVDKDESSC